MQNPAAQSGMIPNEPPPPPRPPPPPPQVLFFGEFTHRLAPGQPPKDGGEVDEVIVVIVAYSTCLTDREITSSLVDSRNLLDVASWAVASKIDRGSTSPCLFHGGDASRECGLDPAAHVIDALPPLHPAVLAFSRHWFSSIT